MFGRNNNSKPQPKETTLETLIGANTHIKGNITFSGGMRIDGKITGNVLGDKEGTLLVISETAQIEGEVHATQIISNGVIIGNVFSYATLELQTKARIKGDVHYNKIEMHSGALVSGQMSHDQGNESQVKIELTEA